MNNGDKRKKLGGGVRYRAPHLEGELGLPGTPRKAHIMWSRLLRKLLKEATDKGYLKDAVTQDESQFERRVMAALSVSKTV